MRKLILVSAALLFAHFGLFCVDVSAQVAPPVMPAPGSSLSITRNAGIAEDILLKGKITSTFGEVDVRKPGSIIWENARRGQMIAEGYQVRTGRDGKVQISIATNLINLQPNTNITFSQSTVNTLTGKYTNIFDCPEGRARFEIKDMSRVQEFKVKTPTAIAGARGTIFYLLIGAGFTEALVEQGRLLLEGLLSGQVQQIGPGFMAKSHEDGRVSDPSEIPPHYQKMLNDEAWNPEGGAGAGAKGGTGGTGQDVGTEGTVGDQEGNSDEALTDKESSQGVEKTQFIGVPDFDKDGIPDYLDPDDDNDFLLDKDEKTAGTNPRDPDSDDDLIGDAHELWHESDPLLANSDASGADDFSDAFPGSSADDTAGMAPIRQERYDVIDVIPGLRSDINDLLRDTTQRQRDWIIDKISDAQRGKVLTDGRGNRTRVEQYVFRPTPNKVTVVNLNYRSAGVNAGVTTLRFTTAFNAPLDSLSSQQIRNLPWAKYFANTDASGLGQIDYASPPSIFP
ncbi:FecR domain-containing protein, partial [Candidatus Omnitrophota bacterium]